MAMFLVTICFSILLFALILEIFFDTVWDRAWKKNRKKEDKRKKKRSLKCFTGQQHLHLGVKPVDWCDVVSLCLSHCHTFALPLFCTFLPFPAPYKACYISHAPFTLPLHFTLLLAPCILCSPLFATPHQATGIIPNWRYCWTVTCSLSLSPLCLLPFFLFFWQL